MSNTSTTSSSNSRNQPDAPPYALHFNDIVFPKLYEDAWGTTDTCSAFAIGSEIERGRIFLMRMCSIIPDEPLLLSEIRAIVTKAEYKTIVALASAVQTRVFGGRHASFAANPVLQVVRFMLIKTNVTDGVLSDRARRVVDFFFDPTLERNLQPLPQGQVSIHKYPAGRLKVAIIGGGPTALASAISLAEKGAGNVEVHMWERRWIRKTLPDGTTVVDYPPTARRRDQVVTLQDTVTSLLSTSSFDALFAGRPERVWPGSANIQIRKVEDRFLKHVQMPRFEGLVHLHTEGVTREDLAKTGDFHVLLGADGAASWVRKSYFHGYENERGKSWALGLAFDRPAGLPWSQPLNIFLTLGQTRYLLNASDYDGKGYLNMQLTDDEWHKMVAVNGEPVHFGRPGCLRRPDGSVPEGFDESQVFAPSENRDSPVWTSISDGLKLFGFKEEEVINVVRIPIVVQAVKEGIQLLPSAETPNIHRPRAIVAVAGDAAMTVHFWPGRGLNSGMKSGIALGDELVHALNHGKFIGMPLDALAEYNKFILKLQGREHDKRSIPILNQSGSPEMLGWLLEKASAVPDNVAIEWLVGAMTQIAARLEERDDWAFGAIQNVEPQLRIVLRQLSSQTLREMAVSFPWPTREMAGAEVLPIRSMKPQEKQKFMQSLWRRLQEEKVKSRSPPRSSSDAASVSSGRYEAPRNKSPKMSFGNLKRSNALPSFRRNSGTAPKQEGVVEVPMRTGRSLEPPGSEVEVARGRTPSPGPDGEICMGRMLSVHRKPPTNVLGDALSLALFRVQEAS